MSQETIIARTVDIETTHKDHNEGAIVEIGWRDMAIMGSNIALEPWYSDSFVAYDGEIPAETIAVHHIMKDDLVNAPDRKIVMEKHVEGADYYIAHNAAFEQLWMPELAGENWICTFKVALRLFPDAPGHSNQVLRYHFGLATTVEERAKLAPHRAGADAYVTALILRRLMRETSLDAMVAITKLPALMPVIRFGKHKDKKFIDLPADYIDWLLREPEMDEDVKHSAACARAIQKEGDHETYFDLACAAADLADSHKTLAEWWRSETDHRSKNHVVEGTPLYDRLVEHCRQVKLAIDRKEAA